MSDKCFYLYVYYVFGGSESGEDIDYLIVLFWFALIQWVYQFRARIVGYTMIELKQNGSIWEEDRECLLTIGDTTYDLSHRPIVFMLLWVIAFSFVAGILVGVAHALNLIWDGITFVTGEPPEIFWTFAWGAILVWILAGLVKYYFTGSAKPFFSLEITVNRGSEDN